MQYVLGSDRLATYARFGEGDIFGDGRISTVLWLASTSIVLVLIWSILRRSVDTADPKVQVTSLAGVALTALLISPISWTHHWVWVLVVTIAVCINAKSQRTTLTLVMLLDITMLTNVIWRYRLPDHTFANDWTVRVLTSNAYVWLGCAVLISLWFSGRSRSEALS